MNSTGETGAGRYCPDCGSVPHVSVAHSSYVFASCSAEHSHFTKAWIQKSTIPTYSVAVPRLFDLSINSPATVEQILWAFTERTYWLARLSTFAGLDTLESLTVDPDGTVRAVLSKDVHRRSDRSPLARFLPLEWRVVQEETWHPAGTSRAQGSVTVIAHGTPGSASGKAQLEPLNHGSRLTCSATVEFKVPLVGGKIEELMGRTLTENLANLHRFTAEWIDQNS